MLSGRRSRLARVGRVLLVTVACLACLLLAGALVVRHLLLASLPALDGTQELTGLSDAVRVERDALGIPTIRGANRLDVARATGFVHAQDRLFQMDVTRRFAAGELSELFGQATLKHDRKYRVHRLRRLARDVLARATPGERALVQAYADGVNAGLDALGARPPEYLLLRASPARWRPEDSVLVLGAMFGNDLENATREVELGRMYARLPSALVDFLRPLGDEWDAPMIGDAIAPPPIPPPSTFRLRAPYPGQRDLVPVPPSHRMLWERQLRQVLLFPPGDGSPPLLLQNPPERRIGSDVGDESGLRDDALPADEPGGSNSWAIAGSHTADGRPVVANDPHLPLGVPNVWYRLAIEWPDESGDHRVMGVSLPGLPFVAIGSNGRIAWGFTVAFDDRSDMVIVETSRSRPGEYRTPDGFRPFDRATEWIRVRGASDERLEIRSTIWGPVVPANFRGVLAHHWQAHLADGVNLTFSEMEWATSAGQALDIANRSGMPSYNMVVADDRGAIGWTVTGRLPRRLGFDGRVPTSWADGTRRWDGWLGPTEYPRILNPPAGRLWTANNRTIDRPLLNRLGLEGYVMGPRAKQVRDDLMASDTLTVEDSLRIQLDDRALFLDRWRTFLLEQLTGDAIRTSPPRTEFRRLLDKNWDGRASVNSVGYLLVRNFRFELARRVIYPIAQPGDVQAFRPGAVIEWWEHALWRMVHERPPHLLPPGTDWTRAILRAVDATIAEATAGGRPLASSSWGTTTQPIAHPLSSAVPWLGWWLDMPYQPLPGDANMPRVRMPTSAGPLTATLRMVVSPGHEETGILHTPGGQSGHPLSPHYRDMQASWAEGRPTPFLPGRAVHALTLERK